MSAVSSYGASALAKWAIVPKPGLPDTTPLPPQICTLRPSLQHSSLPDEIGLLLPVQPNPQTLVDQVVAAPSLLEGAALGLFLANPFFSPPREAERLAQIGLGWVANLPSVAQHDREFAQQLSDVALDHARELAALADFKAAGIRVHAVVSDATEAVAAAALPADAVLVMPKSADLAAGFPSLRQRGSAALTIARALQEVGWQGPLLALGTKSEAERPTLWPEAWDGVVCRPIPAEPQELSLPNQIS